MLTVCRPPSRAAPRYTARLSDACTPALGVTGGTRVASLRPASHAFPRRVPTQLTSAKTSSTPVS